MSETDSTRPEGSRALPPPSAPPGAAASSPRRLYRDPHSWLGGVASGLAAYFEIDPVIVRLLWIVALLTGIGFPAYLVCWAVIPKAKVWPPAGYTASSSPRDTRAAALTSGLVIVALAALIGKGVNGMGDLLLPAALIGFGVYLLNQRSQSSVRTLHPHAAVGAPFAARDDLGTGAESVRGDAPDDDAPDADPRGATGGLVTPTVLSLLAIAAGVCWALGAAGVAHFSIASLAAGGLLIVGLGLLASLWLGRAPGLIFVGVGLAGVLLVASAAAPLVGKARAFQAGTWTPLGLDQLPASAGERNYQPQTLAELEPRYELGLGELTLDLTQIDFTETTRDVNVKLGMGELNVIVPAGTRLEVHGQVGIGEVTALDRHEEGMGTKVELSDPGQGKGTLRVDFSVGVGEGTVRRGL
ncbi:MAG: PspC domain-containing protein [Deltaproteobacteria bacterium]